MLVSLDKRELLSLVDNLPTACCSGACSMSVCNQGKLKTMKRFLITACMCSSLAHAEFKDGNKLLSDLNGDIYDRMHAMGYIVGVYDMGRSVIHCGPGNVTAGQINDMVKNYLENVPVDRSLTGDIVVNKILKAVWPCAKKGNTL